MTRNACAAMLASAILAVCANSHAIELPKVDSLMDNDTLVSSLSGSLWLDADQVQDGLGQE